MFNLELDTRYSLTIEPSDKFGFLASIDVHRVYIDTCFARNNPLLCSASFRNVISVDSINKLSIVRDLWQENYGSPVWSPDNAYIAFIMFNQNEANQYIGDVYVMNSDGTNLRDLTPDEIDTGFSFAWSPDSSQLAFACYSEEYLCISNMDGSGFQQISIPDNTTVQHLSWSPNGNQIAFSLLDKDFQNSELYVVNNDGSHMVRLLDTDSNFHQNPVWSPDSSRIAFRSGEQGNNIGEIYVIEPDGTNLINLSQGLDGNEFTHTWSPDSTQVAFFSYQQSDGMFLYIANADGSGVQRITENSTWELLDVGSPVLFWLP